MILKLLLILGLFCILVSQGQASEQNQVNNKKAEARLGDRVLLKIDNDVFTQRELEAYLNLKTLLHSDKKEPLLVDKANWPDSFASATHDMIIWAELSELKVLALRFGADPRLLPAMEKIRNAIVKYPAFSRMYSRLVLDEAFCEKTLIAILQIADYVAFKEKSPQRDWFENLRKQFKILIFASSQEYALIYPPGQQK